MRHQSTLAANEDLAKRVEEEKTIRYVTLRQRYVIHAQHSTTFN